jgi:Beta-propeller repeat
VFAASADLVYAVAPISSDAFVAKFLPDGKTLVFSTYFGGMGDDTGQGIALDASGDIWITGSTSSYDLPGTAGAFQPELRGTSNAFLAKFSNDGRCWPRAIWEARSRRQAWESRWGRRGIPG